MNKKLIGMGLAFALVASPVFAQTASIPDKLDALVDAAKKEGTLTIVWSDTIMGGADAVAQHEAAFNKLYGTNVKFTFAPGIEAARFGNQLVTELGAGKPASSDVYVGAAAQMLPLLQQNLFRDIPWQSISQGRIKAEQIESDNKVLRIQTAISGISYNTDLVKTPPTKLEDFLQPQWKGKIASTPYAAGFDVLAAQGMWGPEKTIDYVKKLSPQLAGLIRCGDVERIATGEYAALVMDCIGNQTVALKAKGAPVAYTVLADAAQKRFYYISVPKNAPHPALAALFTTYLLSKEGQAVIWNTTNTDLDSLPDSHTGKVVADIEKGGSKMPEITIDWWGQHPEIDTTKNEMIKILSQK
jgi:iron(III) transport system substrate-binding protein